MKSFNEIYEQVHKESYKELEELRKNRAKKALIFIIVAILALAIFFATTKTLTPFLLVAVMMILIIGMSLNKRKYTPLFKEKAIKPFIKNLDENLEYYPMKGISSVIYRQGEFERYDNYASEDLIQGTLDGKYKVQMGEVHTEEESTDSEGNTTTSTIFHGIFGNVDCAKNIGTTLKIRSDKGVFGRLFKGKTRIEMDSQEFEKYFDVYGDNKIITMQILTADVMNTMIEFIESSKIPYELTINQNQIYIRFHTGGVFEPKLFKNSLDYDMLKKYYDIIDFVFKVTREINEVIEKTDI